VKPEDHRTLKRAEDVIVIRQHVLSTVRIHRLDRTFVQAVQSDRVIPAYSVLKIFAHQRPFPRPALTYLTFSTGPATHFTVIRHRGSSSILRKPDGKASPPLAPM
jgi:hypothetical protein